MDSSRRCFLEDLFAGSALTAILANQASGQTPIDLAPGEVDTSKYWRDYYNEVAPRGPVDSDLRILYFNKDDKKGLRYIDQVNSSELLDHPGDVTLDVTLSYFQPGTDDARIIKQYDSSQLRIDCIQTKPFMNILAPAAWVALASLYPNRAGKLPSLQTLGMEQPDLMSGNNKVVLPGGAGKFSVNVSSMAKESVLHKVLREGVQVGKIVSPLVGFPAISLPAAIAFTAIYSVLEVHATFIMKSPQMVAIATQAAAKDPSLPAQVLPLVSGDYIFVPQRHTDKLAEKLAILEVNSGYLVDKTLPTTEPVDKRAEKSIPEITYLSVKMNVTKIDLKQIAENNTVNGEAPGSPAKTSDRKGAAPAKKPDDMNSAAKIGLVIALLACPAIVPSCTAADCQPLRRALVVGISKYVPAKDRKASIRTGKPLVSRITPTGSILRVAGTFGDLPAAVNDANSFSELVEEYDFEHENVKVLQRRRGDRTEHSR